MSSPADHPASSDPPTEMPSDTTNVAPVASSTAAEGKAEDGVAEVRPSWLEIIKTEGYERFDEEWLSQNPAFVHNNVVHETLRNQTGLADYQVYIHPSKRELLTIVHFGEALAGHPGVVHGGIISTIFDNSFGWLYLVQEVGLAYTANLKVDFRRPLFVNSTVVVHVRLNSIERRKLIMDASMETLDHIVHAESSTIFVIAKKDQAAPTEESTAAAPATVST